jgi:uncharacterized membrane protein (DUF4010 family)
MHSDVYQSIAISLGLGLLVGLQREWKETDTAGIRTFPLITLLGTLTTTVTGGEAGWFSAAGLIALAIALVIANFSKWNTGQLQPGITTEVAAYLMFTVGAAAGAGLQGPAIVIGGITAVLLHWKKQLHGWVHRVGEKDLRGLINFVLVALVILPVLPNEAFGPYEVLNPFKVWRMVVLIVGISLAAFVIYKVVGTGAGTVLSGILGGLISSTATTLSHAQQTRKNASFSGAAALVIVLASAMATVRVLAEIAAVSWSLLRVAILPISIVLLLLVLAAVVLYWGSRRQQAEFPEMENPARLKPAMIFGILYALILLGVAAAQDLYGESVLYVIASISGSVNLDAITLSSAALFNDGRIDPTTAWRVILTAIVANLGFKLVVIAVFGSRSLLVYSGIVLGISIIAGIAVLTFWPSVGGAPVPQ